MRSLRKPGKSRTMKRSPSANMSLRQLTALKRLLQRYGTQQLSKREFLLVVRCRDMENWIQEDINRLTQAKKNKLGA